MDINLKSKVKYANILTIIILLVYSITTICVYIPIKDNIVKNKGINEYIKSYDFANYLGYFTESLLYYNNSLLEESLKYCIKDKENKIISSNIEDCTKENLEKMKKESKFYLDVSFDEKSKPFLKTSIQNDFKSSLFVDRFINSADEIYKNIDITYIIPKNFEEGNSSSVHTYKQYILYQLLISMAIVLAISLIIFMIASFCMPYSVQNSTSMCKVFNSFYLEFKLLFYIMLAFVCFGIVSIFAEMGYNGSFELNLFNLIYYGNIYFYIVIILICFFIYLLSYLTFVFIKNIYHDGFKNSIIDRSIFFRCLKVVFKHTKFVLKYLSKKLILMFKSIFKKNKYNFKKLSYVDITKKGNLTLIAILSVHLIIIWLLILLQEVGIAFAFIYTIILFRILLKFVVNINILNKKSEEISNGNFDVTFDENIGVLSTISRNLNNIKSGFKDALEKEVKSQKMKSELISNVSHDLKTPLTSIITYIDLLKSEDLEDDKKKEYLDVIDKKSKRLKILIEDLFEASKASSGNIELNLENLDIIALFRQTIGELEEKINRSRLDFKVSYLDKKVICSMDGRRTYRIFENIITNIIKYSMENSRVYIDILEKDDKIVFTFKNMSSYEMNFNVDEITERFTRADESRSTEGSGLGLAIAKSLIELQNGSMDIIIDGDLFKSVIMFPIVVKY